MQKSFKLIQAECKAHKSLDIKQLFIPSSQSQKSSANQSDWCSWVYAELSFDRNVKSALRQHQSRSEKFRSLFCFEVAFILATKISRMKMHASSRKAFPNEIKALEKLSASPFDFKIVWCLWESELAKTFENASSRWWNWIFLHASMRRSSTLNSWRSTLIPLGASLRGRRKWEMRRTKDVIPFRIVSFWLPQRDEWTRERKCVIQHEIKTNYPNISSFFPCLWKCKDSRYTLQAAESC